MANSANEHDWMPAREAVERLGAERGRSEAIALLVKLCLERRMEARAVITCISAGLYSPLHPGREETVTPALWMQNSLSEHLDWDRGHAKLETRDGTVYIDALQFPRAIVESFAPPVHNSEPERPVRRDTRPVGQYGRPIARVTLKLSTRPREEVLRMKAIEIADLLGAEFKDLKIPVPGPDNLGRLAAGIRKAFHDDIQPD